MKPSRLKFILWSVVALLLGVFTYLDWTPSSETERLQVAYTPPVKGNAPVKVNATATLAPGLSSATVSTAVEKDDKTADIRAVTPKVVSLDRVTGALVQSAKPSPPTVSAQPSKREPFETAAFVSDDRLEIAAGQAGMDLASFKAMAKADHDLKVTAINQPLYVCAGLAIAPEAIAVDTPTTTFTGPTFPVTATTAFQLHSRRGAAKVIYLDFNGHTTPAGTFWNGGVAFTSPAFKLNGTATATDQTNLNAIRDIWYRVSEDYAAWDVDVTTEAPAVTERGQRCVIGGSYNDWLGVACGGISGIGTSGGLLDGADTPNFVFVDGTGSSVNGAQIAITHEVGHAVGLSHMGETSAAPGGAAGYSSGHTVTGHTGITRCGPIMGACYGVPLVQWSKGDYPYSNNTQNEIASISTFFTPRTGALDDHGDTLGTATVVATTTLNTGGIIASSADVDLLKIGAGPGAFTVTAKGSNVYPDVKLCLQLLDAAGNILATNYTATSMSSTLTYNVTARAYYYIKVIGTGFNTATPTFTGTGVNATVVGSAAGWTNYGSLGRYTLTGSWQPMPNLAPVAVITTNKSGGVRPVTVAFSGTGSSDADGSIASYAWNFGDPGSGAANTAATATANHTYSGAPGTYTATLTVTDNEGLSASTTKFIEVSGSALPAEIKVDSMAATWTKATNVEVVGSVVIRAVNQYGEPLRNIAVYVSVTGSRNASAAAKTDSNGMVTISMPRIRATTSATYTFTVTKLAYQSYPYLGINNTPSPATVTLSR